jgi:chromosomal replication initiator protein
MMCQFLTVRKSQDAFFAIFNHLHQSGKQLILAGQTTKDWKGSGRLLSRFRWGLSAEPRYQTMKRIEILGVR